mgnify:CR=1 FL=1
METNDTFVLGGHEFSSRFILGSGKYNVDLIKAAVEQAGAEPQAGRSARRSETGTRRR